MSYQGQTFIQVFEFDINTNFDHSFDTFFGQIKQIIGPYSLVGGKKIYLKKLVSSDNNSLSYRFHILLSSSI